MAVLDVEIAVEVLLTILTMLTMLIMVKLNQKHVIFVVESDNGNEIVELM